MPLALVLIMLSATADTAAVEPSVSSTHFLTSAYVTGGSYSTKTRSRSVGFYATQTEAWLDYYTVGYERLWLERDDAGGRYYTQELVTARASWWLGQGFGAAVHYAYLHEGEITDYSPPATFHLFGGGANYWPSGSITVGSSFTLVYDNSALQATILRAGVAVHIGSGIWSTTSTLTTKTQWTPRLLTIRQALHVPLGGESSLLARADVGRRVFYFDDDLLLLNNQRTVQTGDYQIKATVRLFDRYFLVPAISYTVSEEYDVTYGSLGLKIVW